MSWRDVAPRRGELALKLFRQRWRPGKFLVFMAVGHPSARSITIAALIRRWVRRRMAAPEYLAAGLQLAS